MNEKKITQVINYKTDADGHHLSMTACPYWRMNNHGITDGAKYVGTMECEGCRWYCSKDVEARTIECASPPSSPSAMSANMPACFANRSTCANKSSSPSSPKPRKRATVLGSFAPQPPSPPPSPA